MAGTGKPVNVVLKPEPVSSGDEILQRDAENAGDKNSLQKSFVKTRKLVKECFSRLNKKLKKYFDLLNCSNITNDI